MSGLVNGLQNRLQQFESARHLTKRSEYDFILASFAFKDEESFSPNTLQDKVVIIPVAIAITLLQLATGCVRLTRFRCQANEVIQFSIHLPA